MLTQKIAPLTPEQIADQMVAAFEGGSNHWVEAVTRVSGMTTPKVPWYSDPAFWAEPFVITIVNDDGREADDLTPEKLLAGQQLLIDQFPHRWHSIINEHCDAEDSDVLLQLCLFGEVVYG